MNIAERISEALDKVSMQYHNLDEILITLTTTDNEELKDLVLKEETFAYDEEVYLTDFEGIKIIVSDLTTDSYICTPNKYMKNGNSLVKFSDARVWSFSGVEMFDKVDTSESSN